MYHNFCSIYSDEYAYKGLMLCRSLKKHDKDFRLFLIFLSDDCKQVFEAFNYKNVTCISISQIEKFDTALMGVKGTRNVKEYIWTAKASVMLYLLENFKELEHIAWLDGDTYFFSSPEPIFEEWGDASILLTNEGFIGPYEYLGRKHGIYNTGLMGFKRDSEALKALEYFREKLLLWCYDRFEPGLWSDQLHVCDWPERFRNVRLAVHPGINLTPFKLFRINVEENGTVSSFDGDIYINSTKLVFFHFYGFVYFEGEQFDLCSYDMTFSDQAIREIYLPYIYASIDAVRVMREKSRDCISDIQTKNRAIGNYFNLRVNNRFNNSIISYCTVVRRETLKQGLMLYYSIQALTGSFHMWFCCLDDNSYYRLKSLELENTTAIHADSVYPDELQRLKGGNVTTDLEKLIRPWFLLFITKDQVNIENIAFVDSGCCLLSDPAEVFDAEPGKHVYMIRNIAPDKKDRKKGIRAFSSQIILFCRSKVYFDCIYWWKKKNLENTPDIKDRYFSLWLRIFEGTSSVNRFVVCESPRDVRNIRSDPGEKGFLFGGWKVLSIRLNSSTAMPRKLMEHVNTLASAAEAVLED